MFALVKTETVTYEDKTTSEVEVIKLFAPYTIFEDKFGVQYSPETLISWSIEQKNDAGIYDVAYQVRGDDRFYNIVENAPEFDSVAKVVRVSFTSTAKDLEDSGESKGLKTQFVAQFKDTSNKLLTATDWMLVRKVERNVDLPEGVSTYRAAVVAEANRLEVAINAATDIEELIAAVQSANWPTAE